MRQKGRGGGLRTVRGGVPQPRQSGVAERNLNRFTIAVALIWTAVIVLLGVLARFAPEA